MNPIRPETEPLGPELQPTSPKPDFRRILTPIREKREDILKHRDTLMDILFEGSKKARDRAGETMESVRRNMGARLNLLEDSGVRRH